MENHDFYTSRDQKPLIDIKLDRGDYVGDLTTHAHFGISTLKRARLHMHEIVSIRVYFLKPLLLFLLFFCSADDQGAMDQVTEPSMTLCSAWMFLARQRMAEGIHRGAAGAGVSLANCTTQADGHAYSVVIKVETTILLGRPT